MTCCAGGLWSPLNCYQFSIILEAVIVGLLFCIYLFSNNTLFLCFKGQVKNENSSIISPPMPIYSCLKFHTLQNIVWASQLNSEAAFFWTKQQIQKTTWKKKNRKCFHKIHKVLIKADPKIYLRRWCSHPRQAHVFFLLFSNVIYDPIYYIRH